MKKYIAQKTGLLSHWDGEKNTRKGRVTVGIDNKGREKVLVNFGDETWSAFLNPVTTKEIREKVNAYRNKLIQDGE